ncbi:hypothetical protein AAFF_G00238870 [Aldrovandia affinis]|uniref:Uncharacterized protein n=1 Tax=Aldrovandia affinis TaxID=143900 RepID=A0AAD7RDW6_9TELE|nr:hypothetical protein AAFF_G00238870 [Aldrovandia affinis]
MSPGFCNRIVASVRGTVLDVTCARLRWSGSKASELAGRLQDLWPSGPAAPIPPIEAVLSARTYSPAFHRALNAPPFPCALSRARFVDEDGIRRGCAHRDFRGSRSGSRNIAGDFLTRAFRAQENGNQSDALPSSLRSGSVDVRPRGRLLQAVPERVSR